jgi:adenylate cyclase
VQPTGDEVRVQLDRILASEPFANADRLSRFLRYVVERSLAGEGDRLKEYVIGTEVFDRGPQYDPRLDSIVRVEAGRLRGKLDEYYSRVGSSDPVIVRIRRGSYAPAFERREGGTPEQERVSTPARGPLGRRLAIGVAVVVLLSTIAAWRAVRPTVLATRPAGPSIVVLPFNTYSTDDRVALLAARITDGVTTELARIGGLSVVSHTSAMQFAGVRRPLRELAKALNADLVMEGSLLSEGDRIRVEARLVDAATDRKVWAERFEAGANEADALQRRIAEAASAAAAARAGGAAR